MQVPEQGVADTPSDPILRPVPLHDDTFRGLVCEAMGERLWSLFQKHLPTERPQQRVLEMGQLSEDERRLFRRMIASDAVRGSLQRGLEVDLTFNAEDDLEILAGGYAVSRVSVPPVDFNTFAGEITSALAIIQLAQGHARKDGYYEHVPMGLHRKDEDQLLRLMSNMPWRRAVQLRFNLFLGFRAPFHLAVAKDPASLRTFTSHEEQVRVGLRTI